MAGLRRQGFVPPTSGRGWAPLTRSGPPIAVNRSMQVRRAAFLLSLCLPAMAGAEDWPQFRGPDRSGISKATGLLRAWPEGGPRQLWTTPVAQGYAAPAICAGRVYFNDYDEKTSEWLVRCVLLADGQEQWR